METEALKKTAIKQEATSDNKMVSGSAWMSAGSMISRLMGLLYIIPWMAWMGNKETADAANTLFQIAYAPYAFFLSLATAGIPSAISKQVSYYNALGEFETSKQIYKKGLQLMAVSGVIAAAVMFVMAPVIAKGSPTVSVADTTTVIRSLSPALLIIPMMSVTRGFIQGHNTMAPSAISQVIEQAARIVFMLSSVFVVRKLFDGPIVLAVSLSTIGAFVGAIFSFGYLLYNLKKHSPVLDYEPAPGETTKGKATNKMMLGIIRTAIPFIFIATGITLFQFVDQFTYQPIMLKVSDLSGLEIQRSYGITQANAYKLIMIIISFGAAMAITSVPLISDLIAKENWKEVRRQFSTAVQLLFFIMLPSATGMAVLSGPLYTIVYGYDAFGTSVTKGLAYMSIFLALYSLLGNALQAANQTRPAIYALGAGLLTKILTQYTALQLFGTYGMLISTMIGFSVTSLIMMATMYKRVGYDRSFLTRRLILMGILTSIMGAGTILTRNILLLFLSQESRMQSLVIVMISTIVGIMIYGYLILKTRLADRLIGSKVAGLRTKLRIK